MNEEEKIEEVELGPNSKEIETVPEKLAPGMEVIGFMEDGAILIREGSLAITVPPYENNRHYQMILEWVKEGNTIPPYEGK